MVASDSKTPKFIEAERYTVVGKVYVNKVKSG